MSSSTESAHELLNTVRSELAPRDAENQLTPRIAAGTAPRSLFGQLAAEERYVVRSDRRSFQFLAERSGTGATESYFAALVSGEEAALELIEPLASAVGLGVNELDDYEPLAGCQAYPAFVAWLALNGEVSEVAVALAANFAAWGEYCATIATGMREKYGFDDRACAFFDLFAAPSELDEMAIAAISVGPVELHRARRYARLFQSYELSFWNTLATANSDAWFA